MKSPIVLATILHVVSLALAMGTPRSRSAMAFPSPAQEVDFFEKRQQIDNYHITLCEHSDYLGRCARIQAAWGICHTIIQENNDWASSAKADAGGNCVVYPDYKCAGSSLAVSSAGVANLYPVGFDNKVSSYRCGA